MPEHFSLVITGHRPEKLGGYGEKAYESLFNLAFKTIPILNPEKVHIGMALGWDTATAEACVMAGIPFIAYVPFEGQESRWHRDAQKFYHTLLGKAAEIVYCSDPGYSSAKMHVRNHRMVDDCKGNGHVLTIWNGDEEGGTYSCVKYALSRGLEVINLYPEWIKGARHGS